MKYFEEIKAWPTGTKIFILLALLSLIGIILRWEHVTHEAKRGFDYFRTKPDSVKTVDK